MTVTPASELFMGLLTSLQMSAWVQLGKMRHPSTGTMQCDLEQARATIDLLGVLEEKTRGNLHADEARFLARALYDLRLNYVEEARSPAPEAGAGSAPDPEAR